MDMVYTGAAVLGGTVLVVQFLLIVVGVAGVELHQDMGSHHGPDGGDGGASVAGGMVSGLLTLRSLSAGLTFFGLMGLLLAARSWSPGPIIAVAGVTGGAAMLIVTGVMVSLARLWGSGHIRQASLVGACGVVYLAIPADRTGRGKVQLHVQNRTVEMAALTTGPALVTTTPVTVMAVLDSDTVEVRATDKSSSL